MNETLIPFIGGLLVGLVFGFLIGWFTYPHDPVQDLGRAYNRLYREPHEKTIAFDLIEPHCKDRRLKKGVFYCSIKVREGKTTLVQRLSDDPAEVKQICAACKHRKDQIQKGAN